MAPKAPNPDQNRPKNSQKSPKNPPESSQNAVRSAKRPSPASEPPNSGTKALQKQRPVWVLILALIGVVGGAALFICAVAGLFNQSPKATLDPEYLAATSTETNTDGDFLARLTPDGYQTLVDQQKSFVVFVDQTSCMTADRLRGYITQYATEYGIKPYRLMFSDLKQTSLHDQIKFYPSVAVISDGQPIAWLKTNADEDAAAYNDYGAFKTWLGDKLNY